MGNPKAHVITLDVEDFTNSSESRVLAYTPSMLGTTALSHPLWGTTVRHFVGQPDSEEVTAQVEKLIKELEPKSVFVIEDSMHRRDMVLNNLLAYHRFVGPCGWILIHDMKLGHMQYTEYIGDN